MSSDCTSSRSEPQQPATLLLHENLVRTWRDLTKGKTPLLRITVTNGSARCTAKKTAAPRGSYLISRKPLRPTCPSLLTRCTLTRSLESATSRQTDQHPIDPCYRGYSSTPALAPGDLGRRRRSSHLITSPCAARCVVPRAMPASQTAGAAYPSIVKRLTFVMWKPIKATKCLASA